MKREAQIKGWRREDKIENIQPKAGSPLAKKLKVG